MGNPVAIPYGCKFIRMQNPNIGRRKDSFSGRLRKIMEKEHVSIEGLAYVADIYARKFGAKVTEADIYGYLHYDITPKSDKRIAIAKTLGVTEEFLCGYGDWPTGK